MEFTTAFVCTAPSIISSLTAMFEWSMSEWFICANASGALRTKTERARGRVFMGSPFRLGFDWQVLFRRYRCFGFLSWLQQFSVDPFQGQPFPDHEDRRNDKERQKGRGRHATDHRSRDPLHDLGPGSGAVHDRNECCEYGCDCHDFGTDA